MSVYDSPDLLTLKGAAREYDVPVVSLELAVSRGTLQVIETGGEQRLLRADVEQMVTRTVKRGAGNKVISRLRRS